jgi:hypothetical protein
VDKLGDFITRFSFIVQCGGENDDGDHNCNNAVDAADNNNNSSNNNNTAPSMLV